MAQWESTIPAQFDDFVHTIHEGVLRGSLSASYEGGSDFGTPGSRSALRVYERYSAFGGNRLSLALMFHEQGALTAFCAIASGGSQAMFLKLNTFGEEAFLDCVRELVQEYTTRR